MILAIYLISRKTLIRQIQSPVIRTKIISLQVTRNITPFRLYKAPYPGFVLAIISPFTLLGRYYNYQVNSLYNLQDRNAARSLPNLANRVLYSYNDYIIYRAIYNLSIPPALYNVTLSFIRLIIILLRQDILNNAAKRFRVQYTGVEKKDILYSIIYIISRLTTLGADIYLTKGDIAPYDISIVDNLTSIIRYLIGVRLSYRFITRESPDSPTYQTYNIGYSYNIG